MGGLRYVLWGESERTNKLAANEPKTEVSVTSTADAALASLGLFYQSGAFRADASFDDSFLFAGPFIVSGNARGGNSPLFTQISATYAF
jgi:hypothetical protein